MKRYVKSSSTLEDIVDLLAKTTDGKWVKIFEGITRAQAHAIWDAGFATGDNRFSVEDENSKRTREMNERTLRGDR